MRIPIYLDTRIPRVQLTRPKGPHVHLGSAIPPNDAIWHADGSLRVPSYPYSIDPTALYLHARGGNLGFRFEPAGAGRRAEPKGNRASPRPECHEV